VVERFFRAEGLAKPDVVFFLEEDLVTLLAVLLEVFLVTFLVTFLATFLATGVPPVAEFVFSVFFRMRATFFTGDPEVVDAFLVVLRAMLVSLPLRALGT
jgi:hypothetical protein